MGKPGPRWTAEDVAKLKAMAPKYPAERIAEQLGRSASALAVKAHELKLSLRVRRKDEAPQHDPGPSGFDLDELDDARLGIDAGISKLRQHGVSM